MNRKKPKLSYASIKSSAKHNSLGLLGSYKDTSSEESEEETPAQKDERSVISLVEDFVKEVNGMDTKPKSSKSQKAAKKETPPQVAVAAPAEEPNWGPWKKCIDENTKHPYYWNTETNQVTWSIPPELMVTATPIKKTSEPEHKEKSVRKETSIETESSEPISKKQKLSKVIGRLPNTDVVVGGRSVFATARKVDDVDKVAPSTTLAATLDKKYQQKKDESLLLSKPKSKSSTSSESSESRYESDKRSKWRSSDDKVSSSSTHQSSSKSLDRKKSREKIDFPPTKILSNSLHDEIMNNSHKKLSSSKSLSSSYTTASVGAVIEGSRVAAEGSSDSSSKRSSRSPENNQLKETIKLTSKMLLEKLKYLEVNMMSQYNILSIEIKTRAEDWKAGQLSDEYVNKKFLQAEAKLKEYERTAVPHGWSCDWNR